MVLHGCRVHRVLAGCGLAACLLVVGGAFGCHRPDPVVTQGQAALELFVKKDAKGLASIADQGELRLVGTDRERFAQLLQDEVFAHWEPVDKGDLDLSNRRQGIALVRVPMRNKSGQEFEFMLNISSTDDGVIWIYPTSTIPMILAAAQTAGQGNRPSGLNKVRAWRDFAATTGPQWEAKYGLKGFVPAREAGLFTWSQLVQRYDKVLAENAE